jgi:hypothetical protein
MANLRTNNLSGEQGQNAYRGSVFFDGTGDKLSVPNSADVRLGSNDFTLEAWVRFGNTAGDWDTIIGMWDAANTRRTVTLQRYNTNGELYLYVSPDGGIGNAVNANGGNLNINDWHHVAGVRDGNTLRVYQNGVQVDTVSFSSSVLNNTTDALFIGNEKSSDSNNYNGFISNVRFVNGTCIYPNGTTFTPPTNELTLVPNTVLLACQDSDDVTQEATGKTITAAGNLTDTAYVRMQPKVIPPVGRDAGNAFGGTIQQSSQGYMYFPTGRTEERVIVNNNFGTRGLVFQGLTYPSAPNSTRLNTIEFITVATKGNATDFGDLISKADSGAGAGNLTRGIQVSGNDPSGATNVIQFVTIATTGDAQDFGDVGYERCNSGAVSNQTRLVYSGGESPSSPNPQLNNIEFITFASTGNGTDFGDQVDTVNSPYGVSSPTRGVFMGGSGATPTIQSIEIATTGNSVLFGDLTSALYNVRGTITNGHRGVMAGGVISPTGRVNNIDYITIQSGGQSIDFGDLTDARDPSNLSSMTRGVMLSGDYPANVNIMDFIEIMTTGNAVDFGDCNKSAASSTASNGHGGLADAM